MDEFEKLYPANYGGFSEFDEIEFVPRFDKQLEAHRQKDGEILLFIGGVGFGKTKTIGDVVGKIGCNYPNAQFMVAGSTKPSMKLSTIPKVIYELNERNIWFDYKEYTGEVFFPNGSWFKFQSLDVSREELEGSEIAALIFDEITGCPKDKVQALLHRVRQMSPVARKYQMELEFFGGPKEGTIRPGEKGWWDYPRSVLMCGNPPAPGHHLEDWFIRREGDTRPPLGRVIQASTYENRLLPADYIANLEKQHIPGSFTHKRMMLGMFGIPAEGAIYDTFDPATNIVEESQIPYEKVVSYISSIDFGSGGQNGDPFVYMQALVTTDGHIYVTDEYYSTDSRLYQHHATAIRSIYRNGPIFRDWESQLALELEALGVRKTFPARKEIILGIQQVRARFANKTLFFVRGRTPNLLREIAFYAWASGDKQVAPEGDHALDCLRYIVTGADFPPQKD